MDQLDCAVILAGGQGSRLEPYTTVLPKPLLPVGDVPILEVVVRQLRRHGFRRLILAVNHLDTLVRSYFGNGSAFGVEITYSKEQQPLKTAGPLTLVADALPGHFLLLNGDVLTDLNFRRQLEDHTVSSCPLTLAIRSRPIEIADGVVELTPDGAVASFREKPTIQLDVSMGVYAMDRSVLDVIPQGHPFGMDELVLAMLDSGRPIHTYRHDGEWYDIGCPKSLEQAKAAFAAHRGRFLPADRELVGVA